MQNLWRVLTIFICFIAISCGKSPVALDDELKSSYDAQTTSPSCESTDLYTNVLDQGNVQNLFQCIGWDKEFPSIYTFINDFSPEEFAYISEPLNELFFKDIATRNGFIDFVIQNVDSETIESFASLLSESIDNHEAVLSVLKIVEIQIAEKGKFDLIPSGNLIQVLLEMLNSNSLDSEQKRMAMATALNNAFKKNAKLEVLFQDLLLNTIGEIFEKRDTVSKNVNAFLTPAHWLPTTLSSMDAETFDVIVNFPIRSNNQLLEKTKILNHAISNNLYNCSEYTGMYGVDYSLELREKVFSLAHTSHEDFLLDVVDLSQRFSLFNNVCPYNTNLEGTSFSFNEAGETVLAELRSFVLIPGGYSFLHQIAKVSELDSNDEYVFFDFFASKFFTSFTNFIEEDKAAQKELTENLFNFLKSFTASDIENISKVLLALDGEQEVLTNWNSVWRKLDNKTQSHTLDMVKVLLLSEKDLKPSLSFIYNLQKSYDPGFSFIQGSILKNLPQFLPIVKKFIQEMDQKGLRDELKVFFTEESFFKFLGIFTKITKPQIKTINQVDYVSARHTKAFDSKAESKTVLCLKDLNKAIGASSDFWNVLDNYPDSCQKLSKSKKKLAQHVFEWTFIINDKFALANDGALFAIPVGVISTDMMSFYNQLILVINDSVEKGNNYIGDILIDIKRHLFELGLMTTLDDIVHTANSIEREIGLIAPIFDKAKNVKPETFNAIIKDMVSFIGIVPSKRNLVSDYDCKAVAADTGGVACVKQSFLNETTKKIIDQLKINTDSNIQLTESLAKFINADSGIAIPFDAKKKKQRNVSLDLETFVRFLFDISDDKTKEEIRFSDGKSNITKNANLGERLEIVIREISFLNNFYGSFFMNTVARATKYKSSVKAMKTSLHIMDKTEGLFRSMKVYPKKTKWAFDNLLYAYDSLAQVDNVYPQLDGTERQYGDFIQAVLTIAVQSSEKGAQKFQPLRIPDQDRVEKHKSKFVLEITNLSGLSHLAMMLRAISDNNITSILEDSKFQTINKNLFGLMSEAKTVELLDYVVGHENIGLIVDDALGLYNSISSDSLKKVLAVGYDALYLISKYFNKGDLDLISPWVKSLMDNYKSIKSVLSDTPIEEVIDVADTTINKVLQSDKNAQERVAGIIVPLLTILNDKELYNILFKKKHMLNIEKNINSLLHYMRQPNSDSKFLDLFVSHQGLNFSIFQNLIESVYQEQGSYEYFAQILNVLDYRVEGQSNMVKALDVLFTEDVDMVEDFLLDVFDKFNVPSVTLESTQVN